jgi:hypothetical protein
MHTCVRTHTYNMCTYTHKYIHTHAQIYTYIHTYTHTYTHIHTYIHTYIIGAEKLHAQTSWVDREDQNKYLSRNGIRRRDLGALRTVKLGQTKVGSEAKPLRYSKKSCIWYQFTADVRTYGHRSTQPTATQHRLKCALKNAKFAAWWLLLPQRFSSESTGDV